MQIEDHMYGIKLHLYLLGAKPKKMLDEDWALLDRKILGVIRLILTKNVANNIAKETTTIGLIKILSDMYEKPLRIIRYIL
ncbi:hypothetical protein Patl1_20557 [Pistacia atlantica]|uniref:Uncharacterized protein n=1 Tax=Pistacia atlantica TaxID=434234 RepID=A0ACC1BKU7_9ROSI|nr:hypothetical protein Patl1_20557 [Pistacia atlantica]